MQADKFPTAPRSALALLLSASLLASLPLSAQELGELTLESALNQPLRASIALREVAGLEEGQLRITLASPEEYAAAGLERSELLSRINLELQLQPLGTGQLLLSTQEPVTEASLALLLSARWPAGQVLRDYTLMLPDDGSAVAAPATGADAVVAAQGASYTVRPGDSLWRIAEQQRPGTEVSVPQMMIALQRANEDAFAGNNINRLISGRVLRIPTREEVAIIAPAAAVAQVNAQNRELGLQPLGGTAPAAGSSSRDELTVLGADALAGVGSSDLEATIAALEAELMLSEEELDRALLENQELTARLEELDEQIAILQNIIAIEDERLAQLQDTLAAAQTARPEAPRSGQASGNNNTLLLAGGGLAVVLALLAILVARSRKLREDAAAEDEFLLDEEEGVAAAPAAADQATPAATDAADDDIGVIGEEFAATETWPAAGEQEPPLLTELDDAYEDDDAVALASSVLEEADSAAAGSEAGIGADSGADAAAPHELDVVAEPEVAAEPETFEFKPVGDADGFDLASLTFDESDARAAEESEAGYAGPGGLDECDTKLDLAVAYEAMGDVDGAIDILDEVIAEGKPAQIEEAQRLKAKWQNA